jgi:hypothetical protein
VVLQSTCCLAPHSQTCCFRGVPTAHRPHRRFGYTQKQEQPAAISTVFSSALSSCFSKHAWPLRPRQHLQGAIEHPPAPAKKDQRRERRESIKGARRDALRRTGTKRRRTSRGTDRRNNGRRRALLLRVRRWYRQTRRRGGRRSRRRGLRGRRHRRSGMRAERGSTGEDGTGVDAGGEGEVSQKGSGTKRRGCHSYLALSSSSSSSLWGCSLMDRWEGLDWSLPVVEKAAVNRKGAGLAH